VFRPSTTSSGGTPTSYQEEYLPFAYWGPVYPSTDTERNKCKLYQFPGTLTSQYPPYCFQLRGEPGSPTMDPLILGTMEPLPLPSCYDVDQQVAAQVQHACITNEQLEAENYSGVDAEGNSISFCTRLDGGKAQVGESEALYTTSATLIDPVTGQTGSIACNVSRCAGVLSFYGLNYKTLTFTGSSYQPIYPVCAGSNTWGYGIRCLAVEGENVVARVCNIEEQNQIFRVTRVQADEGVPSYSSTDEEGKSGTFAQIYHRLSNTCLNADVSQTKLILGSCGANWALIPAVNGTERSAVQQTVWVASLSDEQRQQLPTLGGDELLSFVTSLGLRSLQLDVNAGVVLGAYATYTNGQYRDDYAMPSSQYIDYTLYNSILFSSQPYTF